MYFLYRVIFSMVQSAIAGVISIAIINISGTSPGG